MSVVEKTLRKLQEAKQKGAAPAYERPPREGSSNAHSTAGPQASIEAMGQGSRIVLERVALRAAGLLPLPEAELLLSTQYRKIKRPLIASAFGRGLPLLPKGYLIMLASSMAGEGKTFTAMNLALSMAREKDLSVLLVDADVAKPHLSRVLGLEGERGLLDALRDPRLDVERLIRPTDVPTLSFLPAGVRSDDATELLASKRMDEVGVLLGRQHSQRIVLFDAPPLMQTTESSALVQAAGQVLVVVRAGLTPEPVLLDALESLQDHPAVWLMLNQSTRSEASTYYYSGFGDETPEREASLSTS